MRGPWWVVLTGIVGIGVASDAGAVRTRSQLIEGFDTFLSSETKGVSLSELGQVAPGPRVVPLATGTGEQVWSLLASGGALYAATGSEGTVFKLEGARIQEAISTDEVELFAIAADRDGRVFAAGAPNGGIYQIDGPGTPRLRFDPPEKLIWSLLADPAGNLYAGTGDGGVLYRIDPQGHAKVLYRAEDEHLARMAWSSSGKILLGTDGRGLLIEVDPDGGGATILYDSPDAEISAIAVDPDGKVYFSTLSLHLDSGNDGGVSEPGESELADPMRSNGRGARLYVLEANGIVRPLWDLDEGTIHAVAIDAQGRIVVGTGDPAGLYRIEPNGDATLLWRPDAGQLLSLAFDHDTIVAGTGNPGAVFAVGPELAEESWIRFDPIDGGGNVRWGRASWDVDPGDGQWVLRTRTGQTEHPDSSWSPWSRRLEEPGGSQIVASPVQFLQCEARYQAGGREKPALLREVWIPYSEPNLPPRIKRIGFSKEVTPSENGSGETGSFTQNLGGGLRVQIQKTPSVTSTDEESTTPPWAHAVRSVYWVVSDPNRDPLRFEVAIRRVGETAFRTLARDHEIQAYPIDTRTLPEGEYEVRVVASDAAANPPGEGLDAARIGGPFRVDHGPPEFEKLTARRTDASRLLVEGTVRDASSPIRELEISWDGQGWKPASSRDGLLDGAEEEFRIEIELEREDEGSWVAVRASDATGNEAIGRVWLEK